MATTVESKGRPYKSPLSDIEFDSASDVAAYTATLRRIARSTELELQTAADELEALLAESTGTLFERVVSKRKAKKVARHLRIAAHHARGMAVEAIRCNKQFRVEYAIALNPVKGSHKKTLNWNA